MEQDVVLLTTGGAESLMLLLYFHSLIVHHYLNEPFDLLSPLELSDIGFDF
jgi:hypothetical protein